MARKVHHYTGAAGLLFLIYYCETLNILNFKVIDPSSSCYTGKWKPENVIIRNYVFSSELKGEQTYQKIAKYTNFVLIGLGFKIKPFLD